MRMPKKNVRKQISLIAGVISITLVVMLSLPTTFTSTITYERKVAESIIPTQFPVTVDPEHKVIVESARVNALLEGPRSPLHAAVFNTGNIFWNVLAWLATSIASTPWYQGIASVAGAGDRFVTITPGMRKEQVAGAFAAELGWNAAQKKAFVTAIAPSKLPLTEGSFLPGVYPVAAGTTPSAAQVLVNQQFSKDILSHYGTTTAEVVPLNEALTIASLIEREAGGPDDMRLISGVIWNRLFDNMNLQIDATLQYAKANSVNIDSWWPKVVPADIYRISPYNTYQHPGLPPTPIASPSIAAVLAALNPKNTSCLFYFHDAAKQFHCSATYAEHVALLKKYYGRGK